MARAVEETERAGLRALLVTPSADLLYLCGYDPPLLPRLTCLVLRPGVDPVLLVPALERPRAMESPAASDLEVLAWPDGDDPFEHVAKLVDEGGTYGVADRMWAVHVLGLQKVLSGAELVPASRVMAALRAVKDDDELALLSRAARSADAVFHTVLGRRMEGLREEEVSAMLGDLLREGGHEIVNFAIVGSGPNGASPHHDPGGRAIREGDPVVLDFGGKVSRYCSDISRTVTVGRTRDRLVDVYEVVREAQEAAFQAVRPGVPAEEVDRAARDVIERAGYGERFLHRTGHGIGLEEHENPYIVRGNRQPLEPGMCFSIEPGIYLEGEFGVRIEDIVTVTAEGASRLNRATRELETVG